jgi:spermidine synthase
VKPWERLGEALAPDGEALELLRRDREYLIRAGGYDLMSSHDDRSSKALAELGCAHIPADAQARVLVGGLGMGFTLRAALDALGARAVVEVAELVDAVAEWNREYLGELAESPLDDPRSELVMGDVSAVIGRAKNRYDAILLDVDNGPDALAHENNEGLYAGRGIAAAWKALRPGGVLGVWSFSDDARFTRRLKKQGFDAEARAVKASRKGRGRRHVIWVARKSG